MVTNVAQLSSAYASYAAPTRPSVASGPADGFQQSQAPEAAPSRAQVLQLFAKTTPQLEPTSPDIEGPYYRPDAPFTNSLATENDKGAKMYVWGQVKGTDGQPIPNALVDVWMADGDGNYDIRDPEDKLNPDIPYKLRGRMYTDENGMFLYTSVVPGNYEIGDGRWRPGHIHYKLSAEGFEPLTTQIYFENDPHNEKDPWYDPKRVMPTMPDFNGKDKLGGFDFVLAPKAQ